MLCFQYWLHNFTAVFFRMARFESHYLLSRSSQTFSVFFCQLSVDLKCNIILQNISEINLLFIICQVGSKNSLQNYTRNLCMAPVLWNPDFVRNKLQVWKPLCILWVLPILLQTLRLRILIKLEVLIYCTPTCKTDMLFLSNLTYREL